MSNQVSITLAGDEKDVERSLDKMNAKLQKTEARLEKMRMVSRKSSRESSSGFTNSANAVGRFGTRIAGAVSAMALLRMGVRAIGDEWEKTQRKQEAARIATLEPAQAIREARIAFVPDATLKDRDLEKVIQKIATETRAPVKNVAAALQTAFSAKGSLSNQVAADAVKQALRLDPSNPEQAAVLAGRFLDVAKFSGSTDIRANAGFIQNVQSASRVTTSEKVGENIVPAIGAGTNFGDTPEQAAEILAALTQLIGDSQGRISANAFQRLGGQLLNFVPQRASKGKFQGRLTGKDAFGEFAIPDEQFELFQKAKSTKERLDVLGKSAELQRAFIGQASFEEKTKQQTLMLVRGDQKAVSELRKAEETIKPIDNNQRALFERKVKQLEGGKLQQNLTAHQELKSSEEQYLIGNTMSQRISFARETLTETLRKIDRPGLDWPTNQFQLTIFEHAIKRMESIVAEGKVPLATPESIAMKTLQNVVKTSGSDLQSDMSKDDQDFLDSRIEFLREKARSRGRVSNSPLPSPAEADAADRRLREDRQQAGLPDNFVGPVSPQQLNGADPQMEENNRLLRELVDETKRNRQSPNPAATPPRVRTPRSASLSRRPGQ